MLPEPFRNHGRALKVEEVVRQGGDAMAISLLLLLWVVGPGAWMVVGVVVFFFVSLEALQDVPHGFLLLLLFLILLLLLLLLHYIKRLRPLFSLHIITTIQSPLLQRPAIRVP